MGFVFDADVAAMSLLIKLYFLQRPNDGHDIQGALSIDHIGLPLVVVIFEMQAEVPFSHNADLLGRVKLLAQLRHSNQMPGIEAGTDQRVVILNGRENDLGTVPAMQSLADRPMRVDGDTDFVLFAEFVQAVETVRVGVSTEVFYTQSSAKLKKPFVCVMVFGETLHAVSNGGDAIIAAHPQDGLNLLGRAIGWAMSLEKLHVAQAQLLNAFQRSFAVKIAETITLGPDDKITERVLVSACCAQAVFIGS
jgi:hypothetical protein